MRWMRSGRRPWRIVAFATLLTVISAGAISAAPAAQVPTLNPFSMPRIPAQGIAVAEGKAVVLVGLDRRVIGRLRGFVVVNSNSGGRLGAITDADPALVVLQGPRGRGWMLDGAGLRPLDPSRVPLPGGATLSVSKAHAPDFEYRVTVREGHRVLASGRPFAVPIGAGGRILMTRRVATDLATGRQWRPPSPAQWTGGLGDVGRGCTPAGIAYGRIIAICHDLERAPGDPSNSVVRVYAIGSTGVATRLGPAFTNGFGAQAAWLSPNGEYVAAQLAEPCGPSVSIVASIRHAVMRIVPAADTLYGWSADGKLIAYVAPVWNGDCDRSKPGAYLIDPATLKRSLIRTASDFAAWGSK